MVPRKYDREATVLRVAATNCSWERYDLTMTPLGDCCQDDLAGGKSGEGILVCSRLFLPARVLRIPEVAATIGSRIAGSGNVQDVELSYVGRYPSKEGGPVCWVTHY